MGGIYPEQILIAVGGGENARAKASLRRAISAFQGTGRTAIRISARPLNLLGADKRIILAVHPDASVGVIRPHNNPVVAGPNIVVKDIRIFSHRRLDIMNPYTPVSVRKLIGPARGNHLNRGGYIAGPFFKNF